MKKKKADSFIVTERDNGEYNLIEKEILDQFAIKADMDPNGSKQIKDDGFTYAEHLLEPKYNPKKLIDVLDMNSYHENCVDVVARDASGLSFTFNSTEENSNENFHDENILNFLNGINPSINTLLYRRMYDRRAIGYGALEIIREDTAESEVKTLAHIPAQTLRRYDDGCRVKQMVGTKVVYFIIYGANIDENGEKYDVHADTGEIYPYNSLSASEKANELLWSMDYAPGTNFYGRPKIIGSLPTILGDLSRGKYNINFFSNYGMPAFAVTVTGDFADYDVDPNDPEYDKTKTLKYKISQQLKEVIKNPHSAVTILVPSEGEEGNVEVNLEPLSVETKEASFRLFRKDNRDEIIQAHKVDPSRLGIYDAGKLSGTNSKQTDNAYKVSTIAPLKRDNEEDIQNLLEKEFGLNGWEFKINDLDPKDFQSDINILKELFAMAAITPNQIINLVGGKYGLNHVNNPYMDEYYLNGTPLDQIWNSKAGDYDDFVLENLEKTVMGEAKEYDEGTELNSDGNSNQISTKSDESVTERLKSIFKTRRRIS